MLLTENTNFNALAKANVQAVLSMCEGLEQKIVVPGAETFCQESCAGIHRRN